MSRSFAFVFVCQAGRLEIDALMLALSLQHFVTADHELIAAVPTPSSRWGTPRREVLDQFDRMNVRMVEIENQIDTEYPIGNKVSCLMIPTDKDRLVFLDSDILCLRPFDGGPDFDAPFSAKPADLATFGRDEGDWRKVYATAGLTPPTERVVATVSGETMLPYFNAGVIAVQNNAGFGEAWLECCLAIDADPTIERKRPWLDQIALPVAVGALGLSVGLLGERHNFPAHLRRIDEQEPPVFCHYHAPKNLLKTSHGESLLRTLGAQHPFIWNLMRTERDWERVARLGQRPLSRRLAGPFVKPARTRMTKIGDDWHASRTSADEMSRNAIVTGFPRSGTSLYSSMLNTIPNVVCINEISANGTSRFYRLMRRRIAADRPVPNKFSASGDLTTDTMSAGTQRAELPVRVLDGQFVLAQKFTLPYLNRLEQLCDQGFSVWVLVRHPLFAIGSWQRCPPHFAIANINPPDRLLAHIELSGSTLDERRIEVWNHYARAIDRLRDRIEIVRYEDLVDDPQGELARFCARFDLQVPESASELRSRNIISGSPIASYLADLVAERCELGLFGYS